MQSFDFFEFIMTIGVYVIKLGSIPIIGPLVLVGFVLLLIKIVSAPPKKA